MVYLQCRIRQNLLLNLQQFAEMQLAAKATQK